MEMLMKALAERQNATETEDDVMDCFECGAEDAVEFDKDNVHVNKELNLKVPAPAKVCIECGKAYYEGHIFNDILQAEENAKGRTWVRCIFENGQFSQYTLH